MKVNMFDDESLNIFLILMILAIIVVGVFAIQEISKPTEKFETKIDKNLKTIQKMEK